MSDDNERIRANVAKMRSANATDAEIEQYLTEHEGLKPNAPSAAPRDVTAAVPRTEHTQPLGQAIHGIAERAIRGATFGLHDEAGALAAGLVQDPMHPLKNFDANRKQITQHGDRLAEDHPVLAGGAELGGAVAGGGVLRSLLSPAGTAVKPVGTFAKMIAGGKQIGAGAASGAAYGAGTAEDGHRLEGAESGALAGGGMVGGFKAAGSLSEMLGLAPVARNLLPRPQNTASTAGRVFNRMGAMTTEDLAHADVLKQIERAGLTLDDVAANAKSAHPEQMLLDPSVGGKSMLRRARGAQSIPSKGSEEIEKALVTRGENQPGRVQSALESSMGHTRENAILRAEQLSGQRLANSKPGYDAIQKVVIDDPEALSLFDIKEFRNVHRDIARNAEIRGQETIPPLTRTEVIDGVKTRIQNPQTLGTLDKMKQHLDGIISGKIDGGKVSRDRAVAMRDRLTTARNRLDELHPEYKGTRDIWGNDSKVIAAQESGLNFSRASRDEIEATFPRMSPAEQAEFRRSAVADLSERLAKVQDGSDVTRMLRNPLVRDKLKAIAPTPAAYIKLEREIAHEAEMHKAGGFVLGGAQTARIQAEQGDELGGGVKAMSGALDMASGRPGGLLRALATNAATARMRGLGENQVNTLSSLLTAKGPELDNVLQKLRTQSQRQATTSATQSKTLRALAQVSGGQHQP